MSPLITVVSLGPGDPALLTLGACQALQQANKVVLRTGRHGVSSWLMEQRIPYTTLDHLYEAAEDFSILNDQCAQAVWQLASSAPVAYGVAEPWSDATVAALFSHRPVDGAIQVIPGTSTLEAVMAGLPDGVQAGGVRMISATDLETAQYDPGVSWVITEVDHQLLAGQVKLWLMRLYPDDMAVSFFPPSQQANRTPTPVPLYALDQQPRYDHTCCLVVPPVPYTQRDKFCFHDLTQIVHDLRGKDGDPWLIQQTHQSIRSQFLEEAYEVVDALDEGDANHLCEELGDIMLHVAVQSQMGEVHGEFDVLDVLTDICGKMIHRHPEVFLRGKVPPEAMPSWEDLKKEEKQYPTIGASLLDITPTLPVLAKAAKVQYKAGAAGFDWDNPQDALPKIIEEAQEVAQELDNGRDPSGELGDLLFSCVNVIRLCGLDPEFVLSNAVKKFTNRFISMENLILSEKKTMKGLTLNEMDVYWSRVKAING